MGKIAGIAGSLRENSYNRALLRAAVEVTPDDWDLEIVSIDDIPLYNADIEAADGIPEAVERAKDQVAASDALLLVTPEYNNSMPGVFKNAIDWMTRPPADMKRVFHQRPVGLIGATPGGWGTKLSQTAWLPVFRALGMQPFYGKSMYVSRAGELFADGELSDEATRDALRAYISAFVEFVGGSR